MKTIYNRIIVIYIYRIKLTTHNTERQHSAFFILIRLFDIVIKNNGNKLSMCITTILRNKETVQSLTRIQNIPHMYLLRTFHLLVWTVPPVCLKFLEQTCKLFLRLGTKCVFLDTFYFILVRGIEPIKNIKGPRLERIYLSSCNVFLFCTVYTVPLLVKTEMGFKIFRFLIKTMFNYRTFSTY